MRELKKKFWIYAFLVLLSSCQSLPSLESPIQKISKKNQLNHIVLQCQLYDLNGKKVLNLLGILCYFEPNGNTLVLRDKKLTLYSPEFKILWQKPSRIHHQLSKSIFNEDYLSIESQYKPSKKYGSLRSDELVVINAAGNINKSFSFATYFKKNPQLAQVTPAVNDWTDDEYSKKSYEITHVNSFYELYDNLGSQKVLTGYVAHSLMHQKIFILDKELKNIVETIDLDKRGVHDVQPLNENELIFYVNNRNHFNWDENKLSYIETYNLKTKTFTAYYQNHSEYLISLACSSVQPLKDGDLFIVHSACHPNEKQKKTDARLEFVNLNENKNQILIPENSGSFAHGTLINAESYLKLNQGR